MQKLTTEQLEAIRKRAEAATEGPWGYSELYGFLAPVRPQRQIVVICNEITRDCDAEFIEHSREDIPALLAEVERLQSKLSEAEALMSDAHGVLDNVHCYDTDEYHAISRYLNGGDDE